MNNISQEKYTAGETIILEFATLLNQAVYDITGCYFWFTLRGQSKTVCTDPYDADALIRKDSTDGIIATDAANGIGQVLLESDDTKNMPVNIPLIINLRMRTATGEINDLAGGVIIFEPAAALRSYL